MREFERLLGDAPGDARRILRRVAEGDLGRVQAPALEVLGDRVSRNLERLAGAIAFAALLVGGSMLLMTPMGGWHDALGEVMAISGILGMLSFRLGVWLRDRRRCSPSLS